MQNARGLPSRLVSENLGRLREDAEADLAEADRHAGLAVVFAARAGGRFLAMKAIVEGTRGYGSWGTWVAANLRPSPRTVQFYMQLARTLPELADPDADVPKVLESSPAARELAGLSLGRAMRQLGESNAKPKDESEPAPLPEPAPPPDPRPIVADWARKQLPLIAEEDRGALVELWLAERVSEPLDGQTFELVCQAWALGNRRGLDFKKPSRTGRPPRGAA